MDEDLMDEASAPSSRPFSCVAEKTAHSEVLLSSCSPTMDLIAVYHADGLLAVHRMNWHRLWSCAVESTVGSLCWRPDGKALALGHDDGSISLIDAEDGTVQHRSARNHAARISSIGWTDAGAAFSESLEKLHPDFVLDRTGRIFGANPEMPSTSATEAATAYGAIYKLEDATADGRRSGVPPVPPASILTSADESGCIWLHVFGSFPLIRVDARNRTGKGAKSCVPIRAEISVDLQHLHAVVWSKESGLELLTWQLPVLSRALVEAVQLANHLEQCAYLAEVLQTGLRIAEGAQKEIADNFRARMDHLGKLLQDYGFSITADEELVMYVCYGVPSQALLQWLTQHIGSAGIRKLARATDQALLNIHRLLNLHAQPALEQLVFRLGEVLGMQRCAEDEAAAGCGLLGLQGAPLDLMEVGRDGGVATSGLRDLIEALEVLMIRLEGKKQAAVTAASEHRTFFLWLFRALSRQGEDIGFGPPPNTALQHLPPNNPQGLLPFLSVKSRFVGPLSVKVLTARGLQTPPPPAEDAGIDWQGWGLDGAHVAGTALTGTAADKIRSSIDRIATCVRTHVSAHVSLASAVHICSSGVFGLDPRRPLDVRIPRLKGELHAGLPAVEIAVEVDLPSMSRMGQKDRSVALLTLEPHRIVVGAYALPEGQRCHGVAFYKPGSMAVLRGNAAAAAELSTLEVIDYSALTTRAAVEATPFASLLESCVVQGGVAAWSDLCQDEAAVKRRDLEAGPRLAGAALSASGPRGLGFVCLDKQRVAVYDLEADEEAE